MVCTCRRLPGDFTAQRRELTSQEADRYRDAAKRASHAMEKACRTLKPGMSEFDAAASIDYEVRIAGLNPAVTLVSSDDRLPRLSSSHSHGGKILAACDAGNLRGNGRTRRQRDAIC